MAEQLIGSLTTGFEPANYRDEHHERVMEFLQAMAEGEDLSVEPAAEEEAEISGRSDMTKDELIAALSERELVAS